MGNKNQGLFYLVSNESYDHMDRKCMNVMYQKKFVIPNEIGKWSNSPRKSRTLVTRKSKNKRLMNY